MPADSKDMSYGREFRHFEKNFPKDVSSECPSTGHYDVIKIALFDLFF